ncbi:hypothetical protein GIR22_20880 [Pseudomonas sp. CCM 7891]|uniref:Uncharacterized protein n=1 Tax=Pseudomonas karstica TaxID=1055468 RepID=A0A7X2V0S5_9PSED|nr:hypothetical protein [Pseudomonas karstica]
MKSSSLSMRLGLTVSLMGLAIVRSIMNLHQGQTEVSSLQGSFTLFRLVFPCPLTN